MPRAHTRNANGIRPRSRSNKPEARIVALDPPRWEPPSFEGDNSSPPKRRDKGSQKKPLRGAPDGCHVSAS